MDKLIYIAGPMRHIERYNAPAFDRAARMLRGEGWQVLNPVEMDKERGVDLYELPDNTNWDKFPPGFSLRNTAADCCLGVCDSDAIYMLDGWAVSKGAIAEHALAKWLGLEIIYE